MTLSSSFPTIIGPSSFPVLSSSKLDPRILIGSFFSGSGLPDPLSLVQRENLSISRLSIRPFGKILWDGDLSPPGDYRGSPETWNPSTLSLEHQFFTGVFGSETLGGPLLRWGALLPSGKVLKVFGDLSTNIILLQEKILAAKNVGARIFYLDSPPDRLVAGLTIQTMGFIGLENMDCQFYIEGQTISSGLYPVFKTTAGVSRNVHWYQDLRNSPQALVNVLQISDMTLISLMDIDWNDPTTRGFILQLSKCPQGHQFLVKSWQVEGLLDLIGRI